MTQPLSEIKGFYRAIREPKNYEDWSMSLCISVPINLSFYDGELLYASGKRITMKDALKRYPHFRDFYYKPKLEEEFWHLVAVHRYPAIKLSRPFPDGFRKLSNMETREVFNKPNTFLHPEIRMIFEAELEQNR